MMLGKSQKWTFFKVVQKSTKNLGYKSRWVESKIVMNNYGDSGKMVQIFENWSRKQLVGSSTNCRRYYSRKCQKCITRNYGKFEFLEKLSKSPQKKWNIDLDEFIPKSMQVYGAVARFWKYSAWNFFFKIRKN